MGYHISKSYWLEEYEDHFTSAEFKFYVTQTPQDYSALD